MFSQCAECCVRINTLLDLGCDANFCTWDGSSVAGFAKSPQQVDELSRGRADLHTAGMPLGMTPLALVAGMSNLETVSALLQHRCDPDPPLCGLGVTPLMSAVLLARGNCRGVEIVRTLLEARANPNVAARPTGAMWLTEVAVARAKVGWDKRWISGKLGFSVHEIVSAEPSGSPRTLICGFAQTLPLSFSSSKAQAHACGFLDSPRNQVAGVNFFPCLSHFWRCLVFGPKPTV